MKTVTVEKLHADTSILVAEAAEGEVIVVEEGGKPLVEIAAVHPGQERVARKKDWSFLRPDVLAAIEKLPLTDSAKVLEEGR